MSMAGARWCASREGAVRWQDSVLHHLIGAATSRARRADGARDAPLLQQLYKFPRELAQHKEESMTSCPQAAAASGAVPATSPG